MRLIPSPSSWPIRRSAHTRAIRGFRANLLISRGRSGLARPGNRPGQTSSAPLSSRFRVARLSGCLSSSEPCGHPDSGCELGGTMLARLIATACLRVQSGKPRAGDDSSAGYVHGCRVAEVLEWARPRTGGSWSALSAIASHIAGMHWCRGFRRPESRADWALGAVRRSPTASGLRRRGANRCPGGAG